MINNVTWESHPLLGEGVGVGVGLEIASHEFT